MPRFESKADEIARQEKAKKDSRKTLKAFGWMGAATVTALTEPPRNPGRFIQRRTTFTRIGSGGAVGAVEDVLDQARSRGLPGQQLPGCGAGADHGLTEEVAHDAEVLGGVAGVDRCHRQAQRLSERFGDHLRGELRARLWRASLVKPSR